MVCASTTGDGSVRCGYIHWLRNAPAEAVTALEANTRERNAARLAQQQLTARRKRIRKLVHSLLLSPTAFQSGGAEDRAVVTAALIDLEIESIGSIGMAKEEP